MIPVFCLWVVFFCLLYFISCIWPVIYRKYYFNLKTVCASPLISEYNIIGYITFIITVFLFSFVWNWNDTLGFQYYLAGGLKILPDRLAAIDNLLGGVSQGPTDKVNEAKRMAGTLMSIIPLLVLYAVLQKQFVEGIEQTGLTGQ